MRNLDIHSNFEEYKGIEELSASDQELFKSAVEARDKAYAPYSNFHVGAAILLDDGSIVLGNNQENMAYPSGLCAERVALFSASSQFPDKNIEAIAISSPEDIEIFSPCGSCRQVMAEIREKSGKNFDIILYTPNNSIKVFEGIEQLLPFSFKNSSLKK